jgi:Domain of unknown function (DUF5666)
MRKIFLPLAAVSILFAAAPASAHDEMSVMGQVTAVTPKTLQVRMKDGRVVTLEVDSNTRVKMAGKPLGLKALRVGQSVKALGFGDSLTRLTAIDVNIEVAAAGKPR